MDFTEKPRIELKCIYPYFCGDLKEIQFYN